MAKKTSSAVDEGKPSGNGDILRAPAEVMFARELEVLAAADKHEKPPGWRMSPRAVFTYICGGTVDGVQIAPKYIGYQRLVEIADSTLVTDPAMHLIVGPRNA